MSQASEGTGRYSRRGALGHGVALAATGAVGRRARGAAPAPPRATALQLRVVFPEVPSTLDPQRALIPADRALTRQLFEPLLRFGPDAEPQPAAAVGAVAGEGAERWIFTLRPGQRWSGGASLEAEDFVRGWLRVCSREVPDEVFANFRPIRAAGLFRVGLVDAGAVGLRATAPLTFEVELGAPAAHLNHVAALWLTAPVPLADGAPGTGNGPYLLEATEPGLICLQPNAAYWAGPPAAPLTILTGHRAVEHGGDVALAIDGERQRLPYRGVVQWCAGAVERQPVQRRPRLAEQPRCQARVGQHRPGHAVRHRDDVRQR